METSGRCEDIRWFPEPCAGGLICEVPPPGLPRPRLLDRVREEMGKQHCSRRTEELHRLDPWLIPFLGYDIRTILELLGHSNVRTSMVYAHILDRRCQDARSPLNER